MAEQSNPPPSGAPPEGGRPGSGSGNNGGRTRKYVVVVDQTPECRVALRYAAGRARHTPGGRVVILYVLPPLDFVQWGGVQNVMEQEAREQAEALLEAFAVDVANICGSPPQLEIRRGKAAEQVLSIIRDDPDVVRLILASSAKGDPGPLVSFFSGQISGSLPCPVTIVPGSLSPEATDAIAQID
ncbi:universal stress protein [Pedomonas sp. V897]|uniref:universal stress protein n=1 Tax=Pedomonas sp. V897 TaxID=3446482 RepID=UPI003EE0DBB9